MTEEQKLAEKIFAAGQFGGDLTACVWLIENYKREILEQYTFFLLKEGYADADVTCEEPTAIDKFLRAL